MKSLRLGAYLAFTAVALCSVDPPSGPEVTIRAIDARTGGPYSRLPVYVTYYRAKLDPSDPKATSNTADNVSSVIRITTDTNGTATFRLPSPLPSQLNVDPGSLGCGQTMFDIVDVIHEGVVGTNICKGKAKSKPKPAPKPREIVVYARQFSFWDGVFH